MNIRKFDMRDCSEVRKHKMHTDVCVEPFEKWILSSIMHLEISLKFAITLYRYIHLLVQLRCNYVRLQLFYYASSYFA
jgi:hypothetical protein